MADLGEGLFARLTGDADIAAILGTRVFPGLRGQPGSPLGALPAARYQVISDPRPQHLKGYDDRRVTRVQVDCFSTEYAEARRIAELIIMKMVAPATAGGIAFGHTRGSGPRDVIEDSRNPATNAAAGTIHGASIDLFIEHGPA